jgi:TonB family protein
VIRILFWFNPLIHEYKKEICTVHEFQADEYAIHDKHDIQTYCNLLARVALKSADFSIANHFNNSLTLKRITMMNTTKQKLQWWKQAAMIPIAASFFFLVACQDQIMEEIKDATKTATIATEIPLEVKARLSELTEKNPTKKYEVLRFEEADYDKMRKLEKQNNTASYFEVIKIHDSDFEKTGASQSYLILEKNSETNQLAEVTKTDDDIFLVVEETAMPVEGMEAYYSKIGSEMNYPTEARSKGISGKVFVEFVIEKNGTISDMKVLKGIGEGCDEEAMRALKAAGLWKPGKQKGVPVRQRMVMPISFSLGN